MFLVLPLYYIFSDNYINNYYILIAISLFFAYHTFKMDRAENISKILYVFGLNLFFDAVFNFIYYKLSLNNMALYNLIEVVSINMAFFFGLSIQFKIPNIFSFKRKIQTDLELKQVDALGNNGKDFEVFVAEKFRQHGFKAYTTTELRDMKRNGKGVGLPESVMKSAGSGEQGVDVVVWAKNEKFIFDGVKFDGLLIQAKQYSNTVGNKAIQEIYSAIPMYEDHFQMRFKPIVVTNNFFSNPARNLAEVNNVLLVDRDNLIELDKIAS